MKITDAMIDEAFKMFNRDGDDKLNFDEFSALSNYLYAELEKYEDEDDFSDDDSDSDY